MRYRKRNSRGLEEPPGLGSRILRRLSSKTKDPHGNGVDNRGFQNDVPNSPWRYPFRRAQHPMHHAGLQRTLSQDSTTSSIISAQLPPPVPQTMHKIALSRMLP